MNTRLGFGIALWTFALCTGRFDAGIILVTAPMCALCLRGFSIIRVPWITGWDILWFSSLLFFVVAPMQSVGHWSFQANPYLRLTYGPGPFVIAALICLATLAPLLMVQEIAARRQDGADNPWSIRFHRSSAPLLIGIFIAAFVAYIPAAGGLEVILASRNDKLSYEAISPVAFVLLSMLIVLAAFLVRGFASGDDGTSPRPSLRLVVLLTGVCGAMLLICNPFNTPRNYLAIVWTPIILSLLGRFGRAVVVYPALLLSVFVLLPIFSASSRQGLEGLEQIESMGYFQGSLTVPDIDIFDTLVHAVSIADSLQLKPLECTLSTVFFFVPRPWWPDKPVVGGLHVGTDLEQHHGAGTNNLSFFVGGDWYLDGGFALVIVLSCLAGALLHRSSRLPGAAAFGALLIGSIPIVLRGPLGSNIGFPICLLFVCAAFFLLVRSRPAMRSPERLA